MYNFGFQFWRTFESDFVDFTLRIQEVLNLPALQSCFKPTTQLLWPLTSCPGKHHLKTQNVDVMLGSLMSGQLSPKIIEG